MMRRFSTVLLLGVLLAGCSSRTDYTPPSVHPVKGKVTLPSGELLRFGRVTFHAKGNDGAGEPWADIDKDGNYRLTTFKRNDGAVPGQYAVTLEPYSYRSGNLKKDAASPIPTRYRNASTSDLTVAVKDQDNVIDLRLKSR